MDQPIAPTQPTFTQAPVEPKKKSYTWLLILILFFLAFGLSFLAWENYRLRNQLTQVIQSPSPAVSPESSDNSTAEWQVYNNDQYGFSFKYPGDDWAIKETNYTGSLKSYQLSNKFHEFTTIDILIDTSWNGKGGIEKTSPDYLIGGKFGYRQSLPVGQNPPSEIVYVEHNGKILTIALNYETKDIIPEFDLILSTLKFTELETQKMEGIDYNGWETYTNTQYGFELKYPPNFKTLTDKDSLYGWPKAIVLFYSGGQSYDLPVEVWDSEAEYQEKYKGVTYTRQVFQKNNQFITLVNMNNDPIVDKIIASFKSIN